MKEKAGMSSRCIPFAAGASGRHVRDLRQASAKKWSTGAWLIKKRQPENNAAAGGKPSAAVLARCADSDVRTPHFFFSARKRNVPCTVQRKRGLAAALRRLGLLRIDGYLIIDCAAIWKCVRMRFHISAAAAQWAKHSQAAEKCSLSMSFSSYNNCRFAHGAAAERGNARVRKTHQSGN